MCRALTFGGAPMRPSTESGRRRTETDDRIPPRARSGSPDDRLLLLRLLLAVAVHPAAEAVEPHAPLVGGRAHDGPVRRLLTDGSWQRRRRRGRRGGRSHRLRVRRPPRGRPERHPGGERPGDERRPAVGPADPRAPRAGVPRHRAAQALLARGHHVPAHVLREAQREPLQVAVKPGGEGVARRVRARERPPRPRPHGPAQAADPLQLRRLSHPLLLRLAVALAVHVDGHLRRPLLLRTGAVLFSRGRGRLLGGEAAAADGAGDVAGEPLPDAVRVERMAALGEEPELVPVLELAEADGALEHGRIVAALVPERPRLGVGHGGERGDHLGVEPARAGLLLLLLLLLLARQHEERGGRDGGGVAAAALADVDGEEADEEEGGDERDEEHHHGRAEAGRLPRAVHDPSPATVVALPVPRVVVVRLRDRAGREDERRQQQRMAARRRRPRPRRHRRRVSRCRGRARGV
uniref:Uncharacterized protein n=1 Tax=Triticum urartu TaxID=4572 RepID=A0A8R7V0F0_TRIUA